MISIIIPTNERLDLLQRTLNSFASCELPDSYNKMIVVENGSSVGAEKIVSGLPAKLNAEYLHVEWGNKSNALNKALSKVKNDLIVFTDDDVFVHPKTLVAYEAASKEYKQHAFFGGPVMVDREEEPPDWLEQLLPYSARGYDLQNTRMQSGYLGLNWAAFAHDIKELGGFDSRFGPGSETGAIGQESEMQERMRSAGFNETDVPGAVVSHYVPKSRCNAIWLQKRCFQYGQFLAIKKKRGTLKAVYDLVKFSVRWTLYLVLLNKLERGKSKNRIFEQIGYLSIVLG